MSPESNTKMCFVTLLYYGPPTCRLLLIRYSELIILFFSFNDRKNYFFPSYSSTVFISIKYSYSKTDFMKLP